MPACLSVCLSLTHSLSPLAPNFSFLCEEEEAEEEEEEEEERLLGPNEPAKTKRRRRRRVGTGRGERAKQTLNCQTDAKLAAHLGSIL